MNGLGKTGGASGTRLTCGTASDKLVPSRRWPSMWAKVAVFLMKYKFVLEAAKAWWEKRKAKKNKPAE